MASIIKRNKSYAVVYGIYDEKRQRKQKWETYHSEEKALKRKLEIENANHFLGIESKISKLGDLLEEYIRLYGTNCWSVSTYGAKISLIRRYIEPYIGDLYLDNITGRTLLCFLQKLDSEKGLSNNTRQELLKLIKSLFTQAVNWGLSTSNPAKCVRLTKQVIFSRKSLTTNQVIAVIQKAADNHDLLMVLMMQFAFSCSMRQGEILGIQWKDVDFATGSIFVNQELSRVSRASAQAVEQRGIKFIFPSCKLPSTTQLVLKELKTESSLRKVYMPQTLTNLLTIWNKKQQCEKIKFSNEARDYDLVFSQTNGRPFSGKEINERFKEIVTMCGFEPVVFHSLRHSSTSYKLVLSGGNIKAIQGDNGHVTPDMVLSVYAKIDEEDRRCLSQKLEHDFNIRVDYSKIY